MPDLVPRLIGLVLALLVGFLSWADRRYPTPAKPRERPVLLTYCAWCVYPAQAGSGLPPAAISSLFPYPPPTTQPPSLTFGHKHMFYSRSARISSWLRCKSTESGRFI
jgi:hypothetical protein